MASRVGEPIERTQDPETDRTQRATHSVRILRGLREGSERTENATFEQSGYAKIYPETMRPFTRI